MYKTLPRRAHVFRWLSVHRVTHRKIRGVSFFRRSRASVKVAGFAASALEHQESSKQTRQPPILLPDSVASARDLAAKHFAKALAERCPPDRIFRQCTALRWKKILKSDRRRLWSRRSRVRRRLRSQPLAGDLFPFSKYTAPEFFSPPFPLFLPFALFYPTSIFITIKLHPLVAIQYSTAEDGK